MKKQRQPRILKGVVPGRKNKYADSFHAEENTVLVNKLCQYYQCMFGGAAKKTSRAKKDNRWRKIVAAVNAVGGNNRTQEVVKKRYYDIRRMVKRKVKAAAASRKTGGGLQEPDLLPYEEELLQFLGRDNLLGIEGTSGTETSEGSDGTLPLQEEGTITLTAVDPDSVTSVAEEMQSPQLLSPLAALYATIQARQAELETSIQQDRENQQELLQNVITEVRSMSNVLNEGVRQFTSAMVSLQQNMQRFMEMREEECILMRAQAAHNLGITIADVDSLVRERHAQGLPRRDDDDE
ncbi:uncharacterized protein LOC134612212 [Pelobates fuscus]|uniref:uncharacterized protein LOC134612212 n=1 Tax=Pelobates fuscus TaxID=191477 RepID=UPI002FE4382B